MSVFDGLSEIFLETFGELVAYTPAATGVPVTIQAIWIEQPLQVEFGDADVDGHRAELSVAAVIDPREGDKVVRLRDGVARGITTPIRPDGKGLVVCNLGAV